MEKVSDGASVFAPAANYSTVRWAVTDAVARGDDWDTADLESSFVNAMLDSSNNIFVTLPAVWGGGRAKLLRALYGLKSSPRAWFNCLRAFLVGQGYEQHEREPCLWQKFTDGPNGERVRIRLVVYVDDFVI